MLPRAFALPLAMLAASSFSAPAALAASSTPSKVEIRKESDGHYTLLRNGQPFFAKGVGGSKNLQLLVDSGGNSIRTWGIETMNDKIDGKPFLDRCQELGIGVTVGIWVKHERHGFNYKDEKFVKEQRDAVRDAVRKYKDHPAVLMWGLGNEMEGPTSDGADPTIWKELNELASIIKKEDPNHPVMTVIAGAVPTKIKNIQNFYPNIDILGVNAYAAAPGVGKSLRDSGWTKPFMLTEFGPVGHWEVRKTSWGAPIEPTSREKASSYFSTNNMVIEDGKGTCLGTYAFVWGQKQETTATWFGMFLASGEKLPTVDAMAKAWTGKWLANRCPRIETFETTLREAKVKPGAEVTAQATVTDADKDKLTYEWTVTSESTDRKEGGDHESTPPSHPECIISAADGSVKIKTPTTPGAYRLFLTVRDGKGGATADNVPFFVER
jgi:hypothetical protein